MKSRADVSRQALITWYDTMWACCDHTRVPQLAAETYIRHDITGATNRIASNDYGDLIALATADDNVSSFDYSLFAQDDIVCTIGCLIFDSTRQWDWVQLFRVDHQGLLAETWLTGMGGTDPFGFPQPTTAWRGDELPTIEASSNNQRIVRAFLDDVLIGGATSRIADYVATAVISHDHMGPNRQLSATQLADEVRAVRTRGALHEKQRLIIGDGDMVALAATWEFANGVQWDVVSAMRLVNEKITEVWSPVIGGTDTTLPSGPHTRWSPGVIPEPAHHPKP